MQKRADTEQLWQQLRNRLTDFIERRVDSRDDTEDIVQEVFIRILENLNGLKNSDRIQAWVFRITRNAIIDYFRAKQKGLQTVDSSVHTNIQYETAESEEESDPNAELSLAVRLFLSQLPNQYRNAVELTELQGMTQKQAAEQLGLSISGMKSRVQRGREQIKERLLDCCEVELDARRKVIDYHPRDNADGCSRNCEQN